MPADLETIHSRHQDVEKNQVRAKRSALRKRSGAIACVTHFESFAAKQYRKRDSRGGFIVNDQNSFKHALTFASSWNKCILSRTFGQLGIARLENRYRAWFTTLSIPRGLMKRTLSPESLQEIAARLEQAHKAFQRRYPGPSGNRQPIHVVYGGAHLFRSGTARRLGELALRSLDDYAPDFVTFAKAIGLPNSDRLPSSPEAVATVAKSIESDPQLPGAKTARHGLRTRSIARPRKTSTAARGGFSHRLRGWLRQPPR